ncbi:ATP-binding protein [Streptomyces sp. NPDC001544]|uniref:ATP-binding protein n=1 Tax=Streptomyces sp. NPDC001544 TaxID=3364584 RepID=UPI00369CEF0F
MKQAADGEGQGLADGPIAVSTAFEGSEEISDARRFARAFMTDLRAQHGLPVSERAEATVQLVVSELVTNAQKYAPGPILLTLESNDGALEVTVWDSEPALPTVRGADPGRVGQHGLEITMAVCRDLEMHREPVGKRIKAAVLLADHTVGDEAGSRMM